MERSRREGCASVYAAFVNGVITEGSSGWFRKDIAVAFRNWGGFWKDTYTGQTRCRGSERVPGLGVGARSRLGVGPVGGPSSGGQGAYAGGHGEPEGAPEPGAAGSTTLAPARPAPDLDEGDHDRMAHIVLEGYTPKDGRVRLDRAERGRGHRDGDGGAGAVRQGVGPGTQPGPLRPLPDLQGDRRAMGWKIPSS